MVFFSDVCMSCGIHCCLCEAGMGGLVGATVIGVDGQRGRVTYVLYKWSFTLEVELDRWKMNNNAGPRVFLPIR